MALRSNIAVGVDDKILAQRLDLQPIADHSAANQRRDLPEVKGGHLHLQLVHELCLVTVHGLLALQPSLEGRDPLRFKPWTLVHLFATGHHCRRKGQARGQQAAPAIGLGQYFIDRQRRQDDVGQG